jgi:anti-anti-sigma factor
MRTTRADGSLWIVDERRGGRRVITALGRIDGRTAPRLVSALARDEADEPVALDLGAVEIGDGPGPLLLLHAMRHLHARQRGLILLSAQPALRRALDSSGLARRFELIEEGAVGGPRPPPSAATGPGHRAALRRRRVSAARRAPRGAPGRRDARDRAAPRRARSGAGRDRA